MRLKNLFLPALLICIVGIFNVASAQLVPVYVSNAIAKTSVQPDWKGRWVIKGIVNLYKKNGQNLVAEGYMGVYNGQLEGDLPLRVADGGNISANTVKIHMTLTEPFKIGLRHDVNLKPWVDEQMQYAKFKNVPYAPYTSGNVIWDGEQTPVSIFLGWEQIKVEIRKPPPKPIGARYQITGRVVITNAEDGVLDDTCEIYGQVWLQRFRNEKGEKISELPKTLFKIIPQDVMKGMEFKFPNNLFFNIYDDDKSEYRIEGSFHDRDKGQGLTGDDLMWPKPDLPLRWNFRTYANGKEHNYPGDRGSENVEVYITLTKVSDLYKKP